MIEPIVQSIARERQHSFRLFIVFKVASAPFNSIQNMDDVGENLCLKSYIGKDDA